MTVKRRYNKRLEQGLPVSLCNAMEEMRLSWMLEDAGGLDPIWGSRWKTLKAEIGIAKAKGEISEEQAKYLTKVYLRMD